MGSTYRLVRGGMAAAGIALRTVFEETQPPDEDFLYLIPAIPASAGAMIFNEGGELLVLKPTYKKSWTIPGGVMEATGETPWEACQREVFEETALEVVRGRLACVDFLRPRPGKTGGMRFLFDCGVLGGELFERIVLQEEEISEHLFVEVETALTMLSGPLRRRIGASYGADQVLYLEDGRPVEGVRPPDGDPSQLGNSVTELAT
jgi:8-oxo-dGTP pyrophosphatase MutT (NUDIX family)